MIHAVHQTLGEVVGTNCGAALYKTLVLVSESGLEPLTRFCDDLIARADVTSNAKFKIFRWHVQYSYWRKAETASARPVESVVLPMAMKDKLVDDLSEFVSPSTKAWYIEHGVPYKRSYLLHGSPGAGKTSLIQALAGRFKRNVCYLSSLSHPEMTDDGLKTAVQRLPPRSLVVLEDVDTLFGDGRRKRDGDKSALTFSGVLNALDGVGASSGQVFILTTNHRERLDPALIRNGRVDVHIEFTDATPEQMRLLFSQYYRSAATSLADKFADNLVELLGSGRTVSMACLQHYFIMKRKKTAEDAAADVQLIIDEMMAMGLGNKGDQKETDKATDDTAGAKHADAKDADEAKQSACKASATKVGSSGGKDVHVHLHIN